MRPDEEVEQRWTSTVGGMKTLFDQMCTDMHIYSICDNSKHSSSPESRIALWYDLRLPSIGRHSDKIICGMLYRITAYSTTPLLAVRRYPVRVYLPKVLGFYDIAAYFKTLRRTCLSSSARKWLSQASSICCGLANSRTWPARGKRNDCRDCPAELA